MPRTDDASVWFLDLQHRESHQAHGVTRIIEHVGPILGARKRQPESIVTGQPLYECTESHRGRLALGNEIRIDAVDER